MTSFNSSFYFCFSVADSWSKNKLLLVLSPTTACSKPVSCCFSTRFDLPFLSYRSEIYLCSSLSSEELDWESEASISSFISVIFFSATFSLSIMEFIRFSSWVGCNFDGLSSSPKSELFSFIVFRFIISLSESLLSVSCFLSFFEIDLDFFSRPWVWSRSQVRSTILETS